MATDLPDAPPALSLRHRNLAIFDDQIFHYNGREYSSDEAFILFIIGLQKYFQSVTLCSRVYPGPESAAYTISLHKMKVCALPYYKNVGDLLSKAVTFVPKIRSIIKANRDEWDILWLTWPHPLSLLMLIQARRARKFCFLVVRQNLEELMKQRYRGLRKIAALLVVHFLEWQLRWWGRDAVIFTVGEEMYQKFRRNYSRVHRMEISLLSKDNVPALGPLPIRRRANPLRLLFVGRLEPEKGLSFLLRALAILKGQNRNVNLDIVGSGMEEQNLRELTHRLDLNEQVSFHGYIAFGDSLFFYYRAADFFVLPSLSEGIPQVLFEAMAFGIPIIATRIPSLQAMIRHRENGWLVEPGSATDLANAISELGDNPTVVETLRKHAKDDFFVHTLEFQQEKMLSTLAIHLEYWLSPRIHPHLCY